MVPGWQCGSTQIQAKYKPTSASTMNVDLMVINLHELIHWWQNQLEFKSWIPWKINEATRPIKAFFQSAIHIAWQVFPTT